MHDQKSRLSEVKGPARGEGGEDFFQPCAPDFSGRLPGHEAKNRCVHQSFSLGVSAAWTRYFRRARKKRRRSSRIMYREVGKGLADIALVEGDVFVLTYPTDEAY